jgi:FMN phosphatase YigB (HAD superfamily)
VNNFSTILFDLDGTLLDFVSDEGFGEAFFDAWINKFQHLVSVDDLRSWSEQMREGVDLNLRAGETNRDLFTESLATLVDLPISEVTSMIETLFNQEFPTMNRFWRRNPAARPTIEWLMEHQVAVVIATGMLFPRFVIEMKLEWADVPPSEFAYLFITDWENMHSNKPQPEYYREVLEHIGKNPEQCLMVGDNWEHDVVPARSVGIPVFWIADRREEKPDPRIKLDGQGTLGDLLIWFQSQFV